MTRTGWATLLAVSCLLLSAGVEAGGKDRPTQRTPRQRTPRQLTPRQLTNDPAQDGFPSWSPDGRQIVFSRFGGDAAPEKTGLYLVAPGGGEARRLTTVIGEHPDWSPDGRYIVFDGDFGNSIQLVSASGGIPIRIVPEAIPVSRGGQPKWSPEGSRIAFKEGQSLWVLHVSSGRLDKVFHEEGKVPIPACWSRDGSEIYVSLRETGGQASSLWAVSATGQGARRLTTEEDGAYRYADLSPDGSLLAAARCEGRNCNLWVLSSAGRPGVQITSHDGYDDGPAWSPDGKRIAFVSTRSGNFEIWTLEVDPERLRREMEKPGR